MTKEEKKFINLSAVTEYMKPNQKVYIEEVQALLGTGNRQARLAIAEIAKEYPIISLSNTRGYMRVGKFELLKDEDAGRLKEILQHQVNDYLSRIEKLNKRMQPLIAWIKAYEKEHPND